LPVVVAVVAAVLARLTARVVVELEATELQQELQAEAQAQSHPLPFQFQLATPLRSEPVVLESLATSLARRVPTQYLAQSLHLVEVAVGRSLELLALVVLAVEPVLLELLDQAQRIKVMAVEEPRELLVTLVEAVVLAH